MKERIKELARLAQGKNPADYESDDDVIIMATSDVEKFAKLIVRECIAQCWTVSELEHKGEVISECSKRMRKHFGVEE